MGAALNFCEISGFGAVGVCLLDVLKAKLNLDEPGPVGAGRGAALLGFAVDEVFVGVSRDCCEVASC